MVYLISERIWSKEVAEEVIFSHGCSTGRFARISKYCSAYGISKVTSKGLEEGVTGYVPRPEVQPSKTEDNKLLQRHI